MKMERQYYYDDNDNDGMAGGRKMGPRDVIIDVSWDIGMFFVSSHIFFLLTYFLDIYYNDNGFTVWAVTSFLFHVHNPPSQDVIEFLFI